MPVPVTHDFSELLKTFPTSSLPERLDECFKLIDIDKDGSAFRYLSDFEGKRYFRLTDKIELAPVLELYNSVRRDADFVIGEIVKPFNYKSRVHVWDLSFHIGHTFALGNVRAAYDDLTNFLVEAVINGDISIESIYLPLLYIVRHSLELGLKSNLIDVQGLFSKVKDRDLKMEHSLVRLYNIYKEYLDGLDVSKLTEDLQKQLQLFIAEYERLNNTIHTLDNNSQNFKFPVGRDGAPIVNPFQVPTINLTDILQLRYFTQPFLLFTNVVLSESGLHQAE